MPIATEKGGARCAVRSVRIYTEKMEAEKEKPSKRPALPLYLGLDFSTQQVCNSELYMRTTVILY